MNFCGVGLCCPACKGELVDLRERSELHCMQCRRQYPVVLGIPDLRLYDDPYFDMDSDRAKGAKIAAHWGDRDFRGLVDFYYSISADVSAAQAKAFTQGVMTAEARAQTALDVWEAAAGVQKTTVNSFLDIGCGSAAMVVAAAQRYGKAVGVDVAFRWLVVAKKRLQEAGIDAPLICACAEALPFPTGSFDCAVGQAVIEHVRDQQQTFSEAQRVLSSGGRIYLSTPNRFSIGPDPHLGLLCGSFMPGSWIAAYARKHGAVPPKRQLVSARGLSGLMRAAGFQDRRLFLPDITPTQRAQIPGQAQWLVGAYHLAKRLPIASQLLHLVGPLLYAVARKE
jgi:SAM-dependent methyltransferase